MFEAGDIVEWYASKNDKDPFAPLQRCIGKVVSVEKSCVNVVLMRDIKNTIMVTDKLICLNVEHIKKCQMNI